LDKSFFNVDAEMGIGRTVGCKKKEQWQETGIYMFKNKWKWEQMV
jgi:hypothetical protein